MSSTDPAPKRDAQRGARNVTKPGATTTTGEAGPKTEQPTVEAVATENGEKVGKATSNNGRADNLRTDQFFGERRREIESLKSRKSKVDAEKKALDDAVKQIEQEVGKKEKRSGILDTVSKVIPVGGPVIAGIDGIAHLMGKEFNPIKDLANKVQNVDDLKKLRDEKTSEAKDLGTELRTKQRELQDQVLYNFLASTAHNTSMGDNTRDLLDGKGDARIQRVPDAKLEHGDAAYDPKTGRILLSESTMKEAQTAMDALRKQGVVDENGTIIDAKRFDADPKAKPSANTAIGTVSLIAAHEVQHAHADKTGAQVDSIKVAERIAQGTWDGTGAGTLDPKLVDAASVAAKQMGAGSRVVNYALEELGTYQRQEASDMQAGRERKVLLTTQLDGTPLEAQEAMQNLMAQYSGQPLPFGPNAGQKAPSPAMGKVTDSFPEAPTDDPGFSRRYGGDDPGFSRRYGEADPGFSRRYGEADPGFSRRYGQQDPGFSRRY